MFLWFLLSPSTGSAAQGVPEDGDCEVSETSVVNGHGVICQNSWIFINNAAGAACVAVCACACACVSNNLGCVPKQRSANYLVRWKWCVEAVGFGNGSPGAEYGSFLCVVLGGINTKTMQLGGGQVMRGHGREMALLPNAATVCMYSGMQSIGTAAVRAGDRCQYRHGVFLSCKM
jgi:hypothetical protein